MSETGSKPGRGARGGGRARGTEPGEGRGRRLRLLGVAVLLAVLVVAGGVWLSSRGGDPARSTGGGAAGAGGEEPAVVAGIPQNGMTLGDPDAPATLVEFVDLQCPFCRDYSRDVMPTMVDRYVRPGRMKIELRVLSFLGPDSQVAARFAAAAALQDHAFDVVEELFARQGAENSGWVTDPLMREIAEGVPGLDAERALADRSSRRAQMVLLRSERAAQRAVIEGTPSFLIAIDGEDARPLEVERLDPAAFTAALDEALGTP